MISMPSAGAVFLRLATVMLVTLAIVTTPVRAHAGDFPRELQRHFEFAEQEAYAGKFEEATERIKDARAWIREPINKRELAAVKLEWPTVQAFAEAFDGWVASEWGNLPRATLLLKDAQLAQKKLGNTIWAAFVALQLGDYEFGQSFSSLRHHELPKEFEEGEFKDLIKKGELRFNRAKKEYEKAADIFVDWVDRWQGDPEDNLNSLGKRLRGRTENSLARCAIVEKDAVAARRHLQEAEFMYRAMPHHKIFIAPDAMWPKTLKRVKKDLAQEKDVTPERKHYYITEYTRTVVEWMKLLADQAELSILEPEGRVANADDEVEKVFKRIVDLSEENLGPEHPFRFRCDLALANFYLGEATKCQERLAGLPAGPEKDKLEALKRSYFLDVAYYAQAVLQASGKKLRATHPICFEALAMELTAHDKGFALQGRKRQEIVTALEEWVAENKKGALKMRAP